MTKTYLLIDYENVQPEDLASLDGRALDIFVFLGSSQSKIPADLAVMLQPRGESVQYIRIAGSGRNALDFHIACFLGRLSTEDPHGQFHVVSKDKGFDPLIRYLCANGIRAGRIGALAEFPPPQGAARQAVDDDVESVIENLRSRGTARPRRRKTLASTIGAHLGKPSDIARIERLIDVLERRGTIAISDGKISYSL